MEEAGNEWSCPKCKSKEEKENTAQLKDKLKERVDVQNNRLAKTCLLKIESVHSLGMDRDQNLSSRA